MILRAKREGGTTTCDPRAMYPMGHRCAATTQPITPKVKPYLGWPTAPKPTPPWIPTKSTGVTIDPWIQKAIDWYKEKMPDFEPSALDLQRRADMLRRAPVPDKAVIVKQTRTPTRDVVTEAKADNGDTVVTTTAANGAVKKVEVQENKWLIPAAIAAAFFILGG